MPWTFKSLSQGIVRQQSQCLEPVRDGKIIGKESFELKKYRMPAAMLAIFETVALTLWLTKDNLFYLFSLCYIGLSISLGIILFIRQYKHARRMAQLLVGLDMLIYLGLICNENMRRESFRYYRFTDVFEAATIHYANMQKIIGPLLFGNAVY